MFTIYLRLSTVNGACVHKYVGTICNGSENQTLGSALLKQFQ